MAAGSLKVKKPYSSSIRYSLCGWFLLLCALFELALCGNQCDPSLSPRAKLSAYRPEDVSQATEEGVFVVTGKYKTLHVCAWILISMVCACFDKFVLRCQVVGCHPAT